MAINCNCIRETFSNIVEATPKVVGGVAATGVAVGATALGVKLAAYAFFNGLWPVTLGTATVVGAFCFPPVILFLIPVTLYSVAPVSAGIGGAASFAAAFVCAQFARECFFGR